MFDDPVMQKLVEELGPLELPEGGDAFKSLVKSIMYQQLSSASARSIYERFKETCGNITPARVLGLSDDELSECGLSRQKIGYLRNLVRAFRDDSLPEDFSSLSDEGVVERVTRVKGLGEWSARMFLMFGLGRGDVFAPKDLGLRKGIQKHYGLNSLPTPEEAEAFAERWKPNRTLASLYLWKSVD